MIVFKTFFKILKKSIVPIIMYTVMLIIFGAFNMQTSEKQANFVADKPDLVIINNDKEEGITKGLIDYLKENCNIKDIVGQEELDDALFYRELNYIIYIPENFREDFLNGKAPKIEIKSTGDYQSSLAEMILKKYINIADTYRGIFEETDIIEKTKETLAKNAEIEVVTKLDTTSLEKSAFYYNFASYSLLAGCVYVISLILSSFKTEQINKRTAISSMNYKKYNLQLLIANGIFAVLLWIFYIILSIMLLGEIMFTAHGAVYIINSLVFTLCALSIAFLIGTLVRNKEAINGIVNVVALGSSFLCGAFVPMEWLPDSVLSVAHALPTYWYIKTNEVVKTLETVNIETLKPLFINMGIVLAFTLAFIVITNIVASKKRKIA
ncbi:MAG: ABC transporter permease [Clostridia bacterium]|nr:ABC transporter permease [Clostridia bacterium]